MELGLLLIGKDIGLIIIMALILVSVDAVNKVVARINLVVKSGVIGADVVEATAPVTASVIVVGVITESCCCG